MLIGAGIAGAATVALFALEGAHILQANSLQETRAERLTEKAEKVKVRRAQRVKRLGDTTSQVASGELANIEARNAAESAGVSCSYLPPENPTYSAKFIAPNNRIEEKRGELFVATLYLENTGNMPWFGDSSGCSHLPLVRLGTAKNRDRKSELFDKNYWLQQNRIAMQEARVNPGEVATFVVAGITPNVDDMFREYFQPVVEGVTWIESPESTAVVDLYAGFMRGAAPENLKYFRFSGKLSEAEPLLNGEKVIEVDISDQRVFFKSGGKVIAEYPASTGTFRTPTPLGRFKILNKQELRIGSARPHYRMPQWNGFTSRGHGFHALPYLANDNGVFWNEALNHIGQRVSHGCIRLLPEDAKDFHSLTEIGMPIVIHN